MFLSNNCKPLTTASGNLGETCELLTAAFGEQKVNVKIKFQYRLFTLTFSHDISISDSFFLDIFAQNQITKLLLLFLSCGLRCLTLIWIYISWQDLNQHSIQEYKLQELQHRLSKWAENYSEINKQLIGPSLDSLITIADMHCLISKVVEEIYQQPKILSDMVVTLHQFLDAAKSEMNPQPG